MPPVGKIAALPSEYRDWLHQAIVERQFGDITDLTEQLNELLREGGVAVYVGRSAVGAESQKLKRAQESIRATTQAAQLIAQTSPDEGDQRSAAVMAIVQSELFDALLCAREAEADPDPDTRIARMDRAALAIARLSRARVSQSRLATEVAERARSAADAVAKLQRGGALSDETAATLRAMILGIPGGAPAPAAA